MLGKTPIGIAVIFLVVSIVTYFAYAKDKRAAMDGEWRVSEGTLHFLSLFCGWPGAVIAQQTLRHKTRKVDFRRVFWATVIINMAVFSWFHVPDGARWLDNAINRLQGLLYTHVESGPVRKSLLYLTTYRPDD